MSPRTFRVIRQNIAFSILVNAVFLVVAGGGWTTLWIAAAPNMGALLVVVTNGLRARG